MTRAQEWCDAEGWNARSIGALIDAIRAEERERCAKVADKFGLRVNACCTHRNSADQAAAAIRSLPADTK
jgi:hypothetical protein